jgi:hypothetical protein
VKPSVGLLLLELQSEHPQLDDQDGGIDAFSSSALQHVLIPRILAIAFRGEVVRNQRNTERYVGQAIEDS